MFVRNGMKDEYAEHREILGQWKYSIWYYKGEYILFTFFQTHRMHNTSSRP